MSRFLWAFYTYVAAFNFFAWLPIFFLYFNERVDTGQVLLLEAIYYASVVLAEIPCGMISDRFGRWQTLLATMCGLLIAYSLFWSSDSFGWLAAAQVTLGISFALNSGTDTALLFETMARYGASEEYPLAEARAAQIGLFSTGIAVVIGGVVAAWSLRHAYALSAAASAIGLLAACQFRQHAGPPETHTSLRNQLGQIREALRKPLVKLVFGFVIIMTVLNHVPYEFSQPYLKLWVKEKFPGWDVGVVTGVVTAIGLFFGAFFSRRLILYVRQRSIGMAVLLILGITIGIIGILGSHIGWLGVGLLCLRTIPASLSRSVANIWIGPELPNAIRATYLSVQSLAGRLSFSLVLVGLSQLTQSTSITPVDLGRMLSVVAVASILVGGPFVFLAWRFSKQRVAEPGAR